jgi:gliding motility-associated-like protein
MKNISASNIKIKGLLYLISFFFCLPGSAQIITTIAGVINPGYSGDGGPAVNAYFSNPISVALDVTGNIYISDYFNHRIRKVNKTTGIVTTVAGNGTGGFSGDGGPAINAQINNPGDLCLDASGNIYFIDSQNFRVRKVSASTGIITTIAGNGNTDYMGETIPAINAGIDYPNGIAVDETNIYLSLFSLQRICKIGLATGIITNVAGTGINSFSGDGGPAINAAFGYPAGLSVTANGDLYVADFNNNRIRKIDASGIVTTVAGNGTGAYTGDGGPALAASLNAPTGVFVDAAENIFIADRSNQVIRKVTALSGNISTVAGSGNLGYDGDGGLATSPCVKFADPHNVREDADGNLFISDQNNNCIRKVDTSRVVTLTPAVTISTPNTNICSGTPVTFNASILNGSASRVYQWKINGVNTGTNNTTFNTSSLNSNDVVTCEVTVNFGCSPLIVTSNSITITVSQGAPPTIAITSSAVSICPDSEIIFNATALNAGTSLFFQWQINGINVGTNSPAYSSNSLANNDKVACILMANNAACQSLPVSSNIIIISVKDSPGISISPSDTSIVAGSQVQLMATVNGSVGFFNWTPPGLLVNALTFTPVTKPLDAKSVFSLEVTNTEGCTAHQSVTINIYKPLLIPSAFTPNGDGVNDIFRIPPGTQFTLNEFSIYDRWGTKIFSTKDISQGWDGKVSGIPVPAATFVYIITGTSKNKQKILKGTFALIR